MISHFFILRHPTDFVMTGHIFITIVIELLIFFYFEMVLFTMVIINFRKDTLDIFSFGMQKIFRKVIFGKAYFQQAFRMHVNKASRTEAETKFGTTQFQQGFGKHSVNM